MQPEVGCSGRGLGTKHSAISFFNTTKPATTSLANINNWNSIFNHTNWIIGSLQHSCSGQN